MPRGVGGSRRQWGAQRNNGMKRGGPHASQESGSAEAEEQEGQGPEPLPTRGE